MQPGGIFPSMFFCRCFCDDFLQILLIFLPGVPPGVPPGVSPFCRRDAFCVNTVSTHVSTHLSTHVFSIILCNLATVGTKISSQGAAFRINFSTFEGPGPFLKTVVSCTRNTDFEGWRGASMQTCCIFPSTFFAEVSAMTFLHFLCRFFELTPQLTPLLTPKDGPKNGHMIFSAVVAMLWEA